MKVTVQHDGWGNFTGITAPAGQNEQEAGMGYLFLNVGQAIGQSLVFAAGRRGMPVGKCRVSVEGETDATAFKSEGLLVTVEATGALGVLEELTKEAISHCFPAGTLACPLRHTVQAL